MLKNRLLPATLLSLFSWAALSQISIQELPGAQLMAANPIHLSGDYS